MGYFNCMEICGNNVNTCKNRYCSNHPKYSPPLVKEKPKGGAGKPSAKLKNKIKKENGKYPLFFK